MTSEKNEIEANNAAIKDIGSYLLKGWVLSDVHCESCSFPLVRTKDKENWICTSCKAAQSRVNEEPKINNPVVSNNSTDTVAPFEGDLVSSMKTKKNEEYFINGHSLQLEQRTSQSRDASKLLGEKLLDGWALLGEICPNESCYGVKYRSHYLWHYYLHFTLMNGVFFELIIFPSTEIWRKSGTPCEES